MKKKAILISGFGWYEERLKPVEKVLKKKDYNVTVLLSDYNHHKKKYITEKNPNCIYIHVPSYKKNLSVKRIYSHIVLDKKIKAILEKENPDLIYCMVPPNSIAKTCLKYKKQHPKCKYYIDIIDLWPESIPINPFLKINFIFKKWSDLRDSSFSVADHIFFECKLYQEILEKKVTINKCSVLYLYKKINDKTTIENKIEHKIKDINKLSFCYLGSINSLIDIETICRILTLCVDSGYIVDFKIIGTGQNKNNLINFAKRTGANVMDFGEIFDRNKKVDILSDCDYGFNIMKKTVEVGLTIKSVDLFSMGIPLINSIKGDTWDLVDKYKLGYNLKSDNGIDPDELVKSRIQSSKNSFQIYEKLFTEEAFLSIIEENLELEI